MAEATWRTNARHKYGLRAIPFQGGLVWRQKVTGTEVTALG
jgi:hypothetical protein